MRSDPYRFLLRLPQPLRRQLAAAAARSGRSLNAEIVYRLERSLDVWPSRRRLAFRALATFAAFAAIAASGAAAGYELSAAMHPEPAWHGFPPPEDIAGATP
jgi:hypothetical protein